MVKSHIPSHLRRIQGDVFSPIVLLNLQSYKMDKSRKLLHCCLCIVFSCECASLTFIKIGFT